MERVLFATVGFGLLAFMHVELERKQAFDLDMMNARKDLVKLNTDFAQIQLLAIEELRERQNKNV